jgi:hypothetical protein
VIVDIPAVLHAKDEQARALCERCGFVLSYSTG